MAIKIHKWPMAIRTLSAHRSSVRCRIVGFRMAFRHLKQHDDDYRSDLEFAMRNRFLIDNNNNNNNNNGTTLTITSQTPFSRCGIIIESENRIGIFSIMIMFSFHAVDKRSQNQCQINYATETNDLHIINESNSCVVCALRSIRMICARNTVGTENERKNKAQKKRAFLRLPAQSISMRA